MNVVGVIVILSTLFAGSLGVTCYYNSYYYYSYSSFYSSSLRSKYCYKCCNDNYYTTNYGTSDVCCDSDSLPLWAIFVIVGVSLVIGSSILITILKICCHACKPTQGGIVGQQPHVAVVSLPQNQQQLYYGYQGQVAPPQPVAVPSIPGAVY